MDIGRTFFKVGIIYTIGQVLSKIISFIMIPIYTSKLGASGYGQLSLVDTVMNFISTFLIWSIYSGYIRFYKEYSDKDRTKLRNTAITFALFSTVVSLIFVLVLGRSISNIIFEFEDSYTIFNLLVFRTLVDQFITMFICDYSLNYNAKKMVITNLIIMILNIVFVYFLVVIKNGGIIGIYSGYILGSSMVLTYLIFTELKTFKIEFDVNMFKNMFIFSFGLIPCNISATILNLADRYFLAGNKGFAQTGIYSMGYKIGMLIDPIFISPFKSIFTPYKFEIWKDKEAEKKFNSMFKNYHIIGTLIILLISVWSKVIIKILATDEYLVASNLIPIILYSYFINGENEFFSLGIQLKNKTYVTSVIMLIGGIINIILNVIFIPRYGMYGAAISTLISFFVINTVNIEISKRLHKINYNFKLAYSIDGLAICIYFIYFFIDKYISNIFIEIIVGMALIIINMLILIIMNIISVKDLKYAVDGIITQS